MEYVHHANAVAGRLKDGLDEERACHRFAGAFLAPRSAVKNIYVGKSVSPMELVLLKHEWGLSMGAWIFRLQDIGRIDQETVRALWREFRKNGWNKTEPGPALPRESATTWQRQVCSLVVNRRISDEKGAAILGVDLETLPRLLAMSSQ